MQFRGAACTKMHGANSNVLPTVSYSDQCTKLAATGKVLLASYFSIFPSMQHSEAVGDGSHHAHYLYRITKFFPIAPLLPLANLLLNASSSSRLLRYN
ncbi:hypothetical protein D918_04887 [Trichuris suis]|nr:hypothetical protein D918_04887 [Trichuris suis]